MNIVEADVHCNAHQRAILSLVNAYSMDAMGDGRPLSDDAKCNLLRGLRDHPTTLIFLAYDAEQPIGIAICFRGFSTFAARPLVNIHDFAVLPEYRGHGVGRGLLQAVEKKARELGCCKLTLEVQENNLKARQVYEAAGFTRAMHQKEAGECLFLSKRI